MITKLGKKEIVITDAQFEEQREQQATLKFAVEENLVQTKLLNERVEEAFETGINEGDV